MPTPITEQLTVKAEKSFIEYYKSIQQGYNKVRPVQRQRFERIDKQYQREKDTLEEERRAKIANRAGDKSRFRNMTVPIIMPQVETAVSYQTSVFLSGHPIFGVVSSPDNMDAALQMQSILAEQQTVGGWRRQLILFFRRAFKYNFSPLEVSWEEQIVNDIIDAPNSVDKAFVEKSIWSGNAITSIDPYNAIIDPRVPPSECYRTGEYMGYTSLVTRIKLKQIISELNSSLVRNVAPAFNSSTNSVVTTATDSYNYYIPTVNPDINEDDYKAVGVDWDRWAGLSTTRNLNINYKDVYELTRIYVRVLPSEFNLKVPEANTPVIYKLYIVNHEYIIAAERQTNAHNFLPMFVGQPHEDGLQYQTKSLAENAEGFQDLASAYMNSIIASRRRAVTDRLLYDPSRILSAHINSDNPSAKIPVRPSAYGSNLQEAVYQFPYREDQAATSMQQVQVLLGLSNQLAGQNQASQGQFVKGNKTLKEYDDVMQNANGRDQLASILLEDQVFTPVKHVLKLNILQYQGGHEIYNTEERRVVEIDPLKLRKSVVEFKVSDGLTPNEKLINGESFAVAVQAIGSSPNIGAGYNLAPMFSYLMKTQGADLRPFEKSPEQMAYEQALGTWQQLATLAMEKDKPFDQPQPKPEDYGYNPNPDQPSNQQSQITGQQSNGENPL